MDMKANEMDMRANRRIRLRVSRRFREERTEERLSSCRHEVIHAKYEAEEVAESQPLLFGTSWKPHSLHADLKQFRQAAIPTHVEVVIRISISSLLGYILAVGDFPNVVPQSQRVLIAMVASLMSMLFPTLIFSVGLLMFPQMMFVLLLGLALATMLLACAATVGLGFYTFMFGFAALIISGMRFDKATGSMTCFLVIQMALNSQGLAGIAADQGLDFVKALWTETGVTNPKALYANTLVGMMWIIFCMMVGRILPPFRTARTAIVTGLLPSSLEAIASSIDLNEEDLHLLLKRQENKSNDNKCTQASDADGDEAGSPDLEQRREKSVAKLIHDKAVLTDGKIAAMTVFEPRLLRFGPPECSWMVLKALCVAVDRTILASLAIGNAWKDPQQLTLDLEQQLLPSHAKTAALLRECAKALMNNTMVEMDHGEEHVETAQDRIEEGAEVVLDSLSVDPLFFESVSEEVVHATNTWIKIAGPPDRSKPYFDKDARNAMKLNLVPWFKGSIWYLIVIVRNWITALRPSTWRRIVRPPYYDADKAAWCIDFTVGFTALVAMGIYWKEYADLENEAWILISYAFSTTQTAEGTVKKGILRLMGTASGGFSGWLALTICGTNVYGLVAWLTIFTAIATYIGLPRGFKARMGLAADYGYGPAYFVMTQALVVTQVLIGQGDKRTVTVDRISMNAIGIAMAIVLALLPPALYGGNPKFACEIVAEEKTFVVKGLQLLLELPQSAESRIKFVSSLSEEIQQIRAQERTRIVKLLEHANDFYSDSSRLHSMHLLHVDSKLKECLDSLQLIASWVFVTFGFALHTLNSKEHGPRFLDDEKSRAELEGLLHELQTGSGHVDYDRGNPHDDEGGGCSAYVKSIIFLNCVNTSIRKLKQVEKELQTIKYGLCSYLAI